MYKYTEALVFGAAWWLMRHDVGVFKKQNVSWFVREPSSTERHPQLRVHSLCPADRAPGSLPDRGSGLWGPGLFWASDSEVVRKRLERESNVLPTWDENNKLGCQCWTKQRLQQRRRDGGGTRASVFCWFGPNLPSAKQRCWNLDFMNQTIMFHVERSWERGAEPDWKQFYWPSLKVKL